MLSFGDRAEAEALPSDLGRKRSIWEVLTSEKYFKWTLIIPLLLVLAVFMFYPLFYSLFYSTQEWGGSGSSILVGWDNYRSVLHDRTFWTTLGRTLEVTVICIGVELLLGLGIALLWNREFKGQNVVRGLCLLPLLIAPLAMSMVWNFVLQYDFGVLNQVLAAVGLPKVVWLSRSIALYTICAITIWQWFPFSAFVLLAGLKSMPRDVFEAARVDGASPWFIFRRLSLPMLMPLVMIIVLLRTMWLIRLYDPLWGTTNAGVNTESLDWMVWRTSFVFFDIGVGSTLGIISLFLTIIICAILFRVLMKALGVLK